MPSESFYTKKAHDLKILARKVVNQRAATTIAQKLYKEEKDALEILEIRLERHALDIDQEELDFGKPKDPPKDEKPANRGLLLPPAQKDQKKPKGRKPREKKA